MSADREHLTHSRGSQEEQSHHVGGADDHRSPLARALQEELNYDELMNCMRCGFCLPACPTFQETGLEAESPRGRIALMKGVADGLIEPDRRFEAQMNHCLGCRACEPACPAGVKYGELIEEARDALEEHARHRPWVRALRKLMFNIMFPNQKRLRRVLGGGLVFYQRSGLQALVRKSGLMRLFPGHLRAMESIMPAASHRGVLREVGAVLPARGEKVGRVGLFRGCIMDVLFTETNVNTAKLLAEAGFEVVIPDTQGCCGALHAHSGERAQAAALARRNIRAFRDAEVDYIVSNAGGCGAIMVEYDQLLREDPEWREDARWFSEHVKDISTLLVEEGRLPGMGQHSVGDPDGSALADSPTPSEPVEVTYQDSCHLRNVLKGGAAPRTLLRESGNVTFVELPESDRCCGSAGIYNLTQPDMARQILDRKMGHVRQTKARYLLTSNPGCLLQMKMGVEQHGLADEMETMHIVDFLYERRYKSPT